MWDAAAIYLIGVCILLRESIYRWVALFCAPVFRFANRIFIGWAVFLLLFNPANQAHAEPLIVTVVQSEDGGAYQEFTSALRDILSKQGISLAVTSADKTIPDSGLVISVGMKAAAAVAPSSAPSVLNVLIPKAGYETLLHNFPQRAEPQTFSAIYLDQPIERQVRLIAAVLPGSHQIGLLYSTPPSELTRIKDELGKHGLILHEQTVGALTLPEALQELLQNSDVLFALPDSTIYNDSTIRNILLTTYRSGVPLIGFSTGFVKAGALCAVSSTPAQIAAQAATLIRQFGESNSLPAAQYPQEFEVTINGQVAHSLGLHIKTTSELSHEIKAAEKRAP